MRRCSNHLACVIYCLSLIPVIAQAQEVETPQQESRFCSIIEDASSEYRSFADQRNEAEDQKNEIRADQIASKMTAIYQNRNRDLFLLEQSNEFKIEKWAVTVIKVDSPMDDCHKNIHSCLFFEVHPSCSPITVINVVMPATPARVSFLADRNPGDHLVISGLLVAKLDGAMSADAPVMPDSSDDLEGSFTESGAMAEPEYSADIFLLEQ